MTFSEHLRTRIFEQRLTESRILVVFDPKGRYEGICLSMASKTCEVINTSGAPLSSRLNATKAWQKLTADTTHVSTLLIYSRDTAPASQSEQIAHPYSAFVAMGTRFPDGAPDDFQQLCLTFLPDRRTDIAQLFEGQEEPTIANIDNLASGSYAQPLLEAIFDSGEPTKIITGFLVPTKDVSKALDASPDWVKEMRQLLDRIFGFDVSVQITKAATLRAKLWQFLLFSEFASDLPGGVPEGLAALPQADPSAIQIVTALCGDLRSSDKTREAYREAANAIEADLDLKEECQGVIDLGVRDTFAFEEVCYLRLAATCVSTGDFDRAQHIFEDHQTSLWTDEGERQLLWRILRLSLDTLGAMKLAKVQMEHRQATGIDLVNLYADKLSRTDMLQRELDTAVLQLDEGYEEVETIVELVHERYREFANGLQDELLPTVEREGWPLTGLPASADTFDSVVGPLLNEGKRVAYFLTDALRLELAQKLGENLSKQHQSEVTPVCAQLPCVTRLAMASLIPGAAEELRFQQHKGTLQPYLGQESVETRSQRLEAFKRHLGDRVSTYEIADFLEATKTAARRTSLGSKLAPADLLVVTSTDLDTLGEGKEWMRQHMAEPLDKLLRSIRRSADLGYQVAVVATDHGFLWLDDVDAGTTCAKPSGGEWVIEKRRCYIGTGDEPSGSVKYSTVAVGIPCEEPAFIVPRSIGVYKKGSSYFHEGLSLQEALVGRMVVNLTETHADTALVAPEKTNLTLSRKRSRVSSLIISINLSWPGDRSLLSDAASEFDVVAIQNGKEVGRPSASDCVDPATGRVRLGSGEAVKVSIRLINDGENAIQPGSFKVKVFDLKTDKALDTLDLTFEPNTF